MKLRSKPFFLFAKYGVFLLVWLAIAFSIEVPLYKLLGSLSQDIPRLYGSYALRSLFFLSSSIICVAVLHATSVKSRQKENSKQLLPAKKDLRWRKAQSTLAIGVLFTNFLFLTLLFLRPALFSALAYEGVFIEPLSAIFLFAGAAVLGWQAYRTVHKAFPNKLLIAVGLGCLALIFFTIAMEEVSWFQRVFEFETPDTFELNSQGEFNLHNFATKIFENAFYLGAFVCLIGLPFLAATSTIPKRIGGLEVFIGSDFTLCASSLFVAYNYNYWNAFSTQLPYFLTLSMLFSLGQLSNKRSSKKACFAFLATLLLTQIAFFLRGDSTGRIWDATEYKEFFIAFGFLLYAFDVKSNLSRYIATQLGALP